MSVQTIAPAELGRLIEKARQQGRSVDLIDVRTPAEFQAIHAEPARLVPLDQLDPGQLLAGRNGRSDEPIYFICRSGSRAARACEKMLAAGCSNVFYVQGGTQAWEQAGLPVVRGTRKVIPLERQVRIAAGLLVLIGVALGWLVHPGFYALAAMVGTGLVFAGVTDCCGMAMLLAKMPWNRT